MTHLMSRDEGRERAMLLAKRLVIHSFMQYDAENKYIKLANTCKIATNGNCIVQIKGQLA